MHKALHLPVKHDRQALQVLLCQLQWRNVQPSHKKIPVQSSIPGRRLFKLPRFWHKADSHERKQHR